MICGIILLLRLWVPLEVVLTAVPARRGRYRVAPLDRDVRDGHHPRPVGSS